MTFRGINFERVDIQIVGYTWNLNAIQQEFASFWRFYLNKNRSFLDNPLFFN